MTETREAFDPFEGKTVQIRNDLVRRLRGEYACGPTLPSGEPEFGWRQFETPPVQHEAADEIDRLRQDIAWILGFAKTMDESNWRDLKLRIERQCRQAAPQS